MPDPVNIGYDAAGNRTSMADGTGSVSYGYNNLSQLISETRQFTGLSGTFESKLGSGLRFCDSPIRVVERKFIASQVKLFVLKTKYEVL